MSVLCCAVPNLLMTLARRDHPLAAHAPVALLDPAERVCAVSSPARQLGVRVGMTAQQARRESSDLRLFSANLESAQAVQAVFVDALSAWELPVETVGWGAAYVALHGVADQPATVTPLAQQAGQAVRRELGEDLQPALGWDSGKFTARAAALCTPAGRIKLVDKCRERTFLSPLPISFLPLPAPALQTLSWLGVRTLGEYAALPPVAVQQRFGQAGALAQRWAAGRDSRPVNSSPWGGSEHFTIDLDTPTTQSPALLEAIMAQLLPRLRAAATQLEGYGRARITLRFVPDAVEHADIAFMMPANETARWRQAVAQRLDARVWPGAVIGAEVRLWARSELLAGQPALLPDWVDAPSPLLEIAQAVIRRYGSIVYQGTISDPHHPAPERRILWQALA